MADNDNIQKTIALTIDVNSKGDPSKLFSGITKAAGDSSKSVDKATKSIEDLIKQSKVGVQVGYHLTKAYDGVKKSLGGFASELQKVASIMGGSLGIKSAIDTLGDYEQSIISVSSAFSKYGIGVTKIEGKMQNLSRQLHITATDTAALFKLYEQSFRYTSLEGAEKLFKNIQKVVGSNAQEISQMASMLGSLSDQYPELQEAVTRLNESDRQRLQIVSQQLLMTGKITLAQQKQLSTYLSQSKQYSDKDEERRKKAEEYNNMLGDMKTSWQEIAVTIGQEVAPYLKMFADFLKEHRDLIKSAVSFAAKWVVPFVAVGGAIKFIGAGLKAAIGLGSSLASVFKGIGAIGGKIGGMFGGKIGGAVSGVAGAISGGQRDGSSPDRALFVVTNVNSMMPGAGGGAGGGGGDIIGNIKGFFKGGGGFKSVLTNAIKSPAVMGMVATAAFAGSAILGGVQSHFEESQANSQSEGYSGAGAGMAAGAAQYGKGLLSAAGYAATGAAIGSMVPVIGTAVGAVAGALVGLAVNIKDIVGGVGKFFSNAATGWKNMWERAFTSWDQVFAQVDRYEEQIKERVQEVKKQRHEKVTEAKQAAADSATALSGRRQTIGGVTGRTITERMDELNKLEGKRDRNREEIEGFRTRAGADAQARTVTGFGGMFGPNTNISGTAADSLAYSGGGSFGFMGRAIGSVLPGSRTAETGGSPEEIEAANKKLEARRKILEEIEKMGADGNQALADSGAEELEILEAEIAIRREQYKLMPKEGKFADSAEIEKRKLDAMEKRLAAAKMLKKVEDDADAAATQKIEALRASITASIDAQKAVLTATTQDREAAQDAMTAARQVSVSFGDEGAAKRSAELEAEARGKIQSEREAIKARLDGMALIEKKEQELREAGYRQEARRNAKIAVSAGKMKEADMEKAISEEVAQRIKADADSGVIARASAAARNQLEAQLLGLTIKEFEINQNQLKTSTERANIMKSLAASQLGLAQSAAEFAAAFTGSGGVAAVMGEYTKYVQDAGTAQEAIGQQLKDEAKIREGLKKGSGEYVASLNRSRDLQKELMQIVKQVGDAIRAEFDYRQKIADLVGNTASAQKELLDAYTEYVTAQGGGNISGQIAETNTALEAQKQRLREAADAGRDMIKALEDVAEGRGTDEQKKKVEALYLAQRKLIEQTKTGAEREKALADLEKSRTRDGLKTTAFYAEARQRVVRDESSIIKIRTEQAKLARKQLDTRNEAITVAESELANLEATKQLNDNLVTGIGASVQMRQQVIAQLQTVRGLLQQQLADENTIHDAELKRINDTLTGEEKIAALKMEELRHTKNINEFQTKITQNMAKEAEEARAMRDGWVSAIQSQMIGTGRIMKIAVAADKNMRQSLNYYGNVVSATSGATTGGFGQSERFNAVGGNLQVNAPNTGQAYSIPNGPNPAQTNAAVQSLRASAAAGNPAAQAALNVRNAGVSVAAGAQPTAIGPMIAGIVGGIGGSSTTSSSSGGIFGRVGSAVGGIGGGGSSSGGIFGGIGRTVSGAVSDMAPSSSSGRGITLNMSFNFNVADQTQVITTVTDQIKKAFSQLQFGKIQ